MENDFMSTNVKCSMELKQSGKKIAIDHSSENAVIIPPINLSNAKILGVSVNKFSITPKNDEKNQRTESFTLDVDFEDDVDEKDAQIFIQNVARHISYLLAKDEVNPQNGFCYAELNLFDLEILKNNENVFGDKINVGEKSFFVRHSMSLVISTVLQFNKNQWNINSDAYNSIILDIYYEGLKANTVKAKFFHWFLILEFIEHSAACKRNFFEPLFMEEELDSLAKNFKKDSDKYNAILNLKNRTKDSRANKLYQMLKNIGIDKYTLREIEKPHTLEISQIQKIIDCRNKLFHKGQDFDEKLLWDHLFPLIRDIVEKFMENPKIFD